MAKAQINLFLCQHDLPGPPDLPSWRFVLDGSAWRGWSSACGLVTPAYTCLEAAERAARDLEAGAALYPLAEDRPIEARPRFIAIGPIGQAVADG